MDKLLDKIHGFGSKKFLIVMGVVCAAIIGAFVYLIVLPAMTDIDNLNNDISSLKSSIQQDKGIVAKLPEFKKEYAKLGESLKESLKRLPDSKEIPTLLSTISSLAKKNGLKVNRFKPVAEKPKAHYAEVPVELKLTGTYSSIAMFFHEVSKLPRIVSVPGLKLGGAKINSGSNIMTAQCQAITFRFLE